MLERNHRRIRKWLILGITGLASGLLTLFVFRSIPMASGTAAIAVVSLIAAKHLALFVAAGSPLAALFQMLKPKVRPYCPWAPEDEE
jgi:hypothetical protein